MQASSKMLATTQRRAAALIALAGVLGTLVGAAVARMLGADRPFVAHGSRGRNARAAALPKHARSCARALFQTRCRRARGRSQLQRDWGAWHPLYHLPVRDSALAGRGLRQARGSEQVTCWLRTPATTRSERAQARPRQGNRGDARSRWMRDSSSVGLLSSLAPTRCCTCAPPNRT